jgi:hypothetical protein
MVILLGALAAIAMIAGPAAGQTQRKSPSLDQPPLDDFDRELLRGLPGAKSSESSPSRSENKGGDDVKKLGNPIANLAERMRAVQIRMAQRDTSSATQSEQTQILTDLDTLLQAATKSRQTGERPSRDGNAQAGTGNGLVTPGAPRDSTNRVERGEVQPTESVDAKDVVRRIWGHLPEKLRDEMQASFSEQFLPKYERLIEEYYKRLSEERTKAP